MLRHRNLVANTLQMRAWCSAHADPERSVSGVIPFFHSYGLTVVMNLSISVGGATVLLPRFVMEDVLRAIAASARRFFPPCRQCIMPLPTTPSLAARYDLRSICACISGAAPLPSEVAEAFESVTGARLVEGYGLTETSPVTHCNPVYGERRVGSIGLPTPLTEARVVDPDRGQGSGIRD